MTVTDVHKDPTTHTMVISSEHDATVERLWQIWADPRQLERWWGPPTYPATFVDHDLTPGGSVTYVMTGPEGDQHGGWWRITAVDAPHRLEFDDGFADAEGNQNPDMPVTRIVVELRERDGGRSSMAITSTFPSLETMEQLIAMGMEEGMVLAMGQIDPILAEPATA